MERSKKTIKTRPLPESQILKFENELSHYPCEEALRDKSVDEQAEVFHNFLRDNLDKLFPEKTVKISSLDKNWMSPTLKQLHMKMTREYHRKRRSDKYKRLKAKFRKMKRKTMLSLYLN